MTDERSDRFVELAAREPDELSEEEKQELAKLAEEVRCEIRAITHTL